MSQNEPSWGSRFVSSLGRELSALWVFGWSLIVVLLNAGTLQESLRALPTLVYPSVAGIVTHSEIRHESVERDGRTVASFQPSVSYRYSVAGRDFTGDQIRFDSGLPTSSMNPRSLQRLIRRFPKGQSVVVYYDPLAPERSALDRQIGGRALFMAMILLPFNLVMIAGWTLIVRRWRGSSRRPMRREGTRWIVRRAHGDPWLVALIIAGAVDLLGMLIATANDWEQSTLAMSAYWACLISISVAAYFHTRASALSEPPTLIVDDVARTVMWPAQADDATGLTIQADRISSVEIVDSKPSATPHDNNVDYSIQLNFIADSGQPMSREVLQTSHGAEAGWLAEWLEDWRRASIPA